MGATIEEIKARALQRMLARQQQMQQQPQPQPQPQTLPTGRESPQQFSPSQMPPMQQPPGQSLEEMMFGGANPAVPQPQQPMDPRFQAGDMTHNAPPERTGAQRTVDWLMNGEGGSGGGVSQFDSLLSGIGDAALGGNYGAYQAGSQALSQYGVPGNSLPGMLMGGVNAASNQLFGGGNSLIDSSAQDQAIDDAYKAHPGANIVGQLIGSIAPGGIASAGASTILRAFATKGKFGAKVAKYLADTGIGKTLVGSMQGASQGGLYNYAKGENAAEGALTGGIAGGAFTGAGSLLGMGARAMTDSNARTRAEAAIGQFVKNANRSEANPEGMIDPAQIAGNLDQLGSAGTLMDADPGASDLARGLINNPGSRDDAFQVRNLMEERLGIRNGVTAGQGTVQNEFEQTVNDLLPKTFLQPSGATTSGPRAMDVMKAAGKEYTDSLQPEFSTVLQAHKTRYKVNNILSQIMPARTTSGTRRAGGKDAEVIINRAINNVGLKKDTAVRADAIHELRKEIADAIDTSWNTDSSVGNQTRALLVDVKNRLSKFLEQEVPGFAEVNKKFATEKSYERMYKVGTQLTRGGVNAMSPKMVATTIANANPGDLVGLLEGLSHSLLVGMEQAGGEGRTIRMLTSNDQVVKTLNVALGKDVAGKVVDAANKAAKLAATARPMVGQSPTAGSLAAAGAFHADRRSTIRAMIAGLAGVNELTGGAFGTSQAAGLGAINSMVSGQPIPAVTREASRILSRQGKEATAEIPNIMQAREMADTPVTPVTLAGQDAYLQRIRNTGPWQKNSLLTNLMTTDIGQTGPYALSTSPGKQLTVNTQADTDARRRKRKAKANGGR